MPSAYFHSSNANALLRYGFRLAKGGAHTSRTMMRTELECLLRAVPEAAPDSAYSEAVVEQNALGKDTVSSRKKSFAHLRDLYGLSSQIPLFSALRILHRLSPDSIAPLACLAVLARDPLLRATSDAVLSRTEGHAVSPADLIPALEKEFPSVYSPKSLLSIAQNCASSWAQAGLLQGKARKTRVHPMPSPAACVFAFLLGEVTGHHGAAVFSSPWCRALDLDSDGARRQGFEAHRNGWINLRAIGDVVEIGFPCLPESLVHSA